MRKELELIQNIERYLLGEMHKEETLLFENEIAANPALQEEVELQKQLMQGMQRCVWRQEAQNAFAKYSFTQNLLKWAYIGTSVVIVSLGIGYFLSPKHEPTKNTIVLESPQDIAVNENSSENVYQVLNGNSFTINAARDTIVKTKGGDLIEIPKELFADSLTKNDTGLVILKNTEQAKIYTLHFYSPNLPDSVKKWKKLMKEKNYKGTLRSLATSANLKKYFKTSAKEQVITTKDSVSTTNNNDTIYQVVCGLNMEKVTAPVNSNNRSPVYKLKGKIPFINKISKNKNTILVFDVNNKNKTSIDSAVVIEVVDQLKNKTLTTKKNK